MDNSKDTYRHSPSHGDASIVRLIGRIKQYNFITWVYYCPEQKQYLVWRPIQKRISLQGQHNKDVDIATGQTKQEWKEERKKRTRKDSSSKSLGLTAANGDISERVDLKTVRVLHYLGQAVANPLHMPADSQRQSIKQVADVIA